VKRLAAARHPEIIAVSLGIAQAIGFAWASVVAEGNGSPVTYAMALTRGLFLGYALAFGLIKAAHDVPRIAGKKAQRLGWVALVGLLLISPVIIAPAIQHAIPSDVLSSPLARWLWAGAIAAAPDLVAIGIAVNGKLSQPATQKNADLQKSAKVKTPPAFACDWCGATIKADGEPFANVQQVSAHKRTCKERSINK